MKAFLKGFAIGVVFAVALFVIIGISTGEMEKLVHWLFTKRVWDLLLLVLGSGFAWGVIISLCAWIGHKDKQNDEVNALMRQYLEKKLKEEGKI